MGLKIEFTDKEITPWGGMSLLKRLIDESKINEQLHSDMLRLPQQESNRGYDPVQLINNFWVSIWCGANHFEHLEVTRQDKVLQELFGWKRMAGHKAFERYFKKFTQATNQQVFGKLFTWFFQQFTFDRYTLDLDSTILTRYGEQEGAARGYNPTKRGRKSHHPLLAFIAESRMVVNGWLRSGNSYSANNFIAFWEETLSRLPGKLIGLLRADSGFFDAKILENLEDRATPINYIIAVKFYAPLQRLLAASEGWTSLAEGIEIKELLYQALDWTRARRIIAVRQHIAQRPNAGGKQLRLFADETLYNNYRYSAYVTNLDLPTQMIWKMYRDRADAENRIKELKNDFGMDSFVMQKFFATEAALNFAFMAYNLMSVFRQVILKQKVQHTLRTLRYKVFAIGSYIVTDGNTKILKLSLAMQRREWFKGLWSRCDEFAWPTFQ